MSTRTYKVKYHQVVKLLLIECTGEVEASSKDEALEKFLDKDLSQVKNIAKEKVFEDVDRIKDTVLEIVSVKLKKNI